MSGAYSLVGIRVPFACDPHVLLHMFLLLKINIFYSRTRMRQTERQTLPVATCTCVGQEAMMMQTPCYRGRERQAHETNISSKNCISGWGDVSMDTTCVKIGSHSALSDSISNIKPIPSDLHATPGLPLKTQCEQTLKPPLYKALFLLCGV